MLSHSCRDDIIVSFMRMSSEEIVMRRFGGQSEGSEGVHNHVDPEHLDGSKNSLLGLKCRDEDNDHGYYVNC